MACASRSWMFLLIWRRFWGHLAWLSTLIFSVECTFSSIQRNAWSVLENTMEPAHGIIELKIHADGLPVRGLEATIVANFGSHWNTKVISICDRIFCLQLIAYECARVRGTKCCVAGGRKSEQLTFECYHNFLFMSPQGLFVNPGCLPSYSLSLITLLLPFITVG